MKFAPSLTLALVSTVGSSGTATTTTMSSTSAEPNPPVWPESVKLIYPHDSPEHIQELTKESQDPYDHEHQTFTSDRHFTSDRCALLFHPGTYKDVNVEVGYYTQVLGLGSKPDQVQFVASKNSVNDKHKTGPFSPALNAHHHPERDGTCLDTFWKSAENFQVTGNMTWAVSQAAPLRNVHVTENLRLHDGKAYASGGHLANSQVDGTLDAGTQQQFLYRNVHIGKLHKGGAWSLVHVGGTGTGVPVPSPGSDEEPAHTHVAPRVRMEKPFVAVTENGLFQLHVPKAILGNDERRLNGVEWNADDTEIRDFNKVRVVKDTDEIQSIQEALSSGKDVVLSPGIYHLTESLRLERDNQVLLGLGLATLVAPKDGSPCIYVKPGTAGVRVGGVMLEASEQQQDAAQDSSLLQWGDANIADPGNTASPGGLFDLFCRVGGATLGDRTAISVNTMVRLHSGHVVGDNLWLWRADHAELRPSEKANYPHISTLYRQSEQDEFRVANGLVVTSDNVTIYGLAVEHANEQQTIWSGEDGLVAFYQSEYPYGVTADRFQYPGYLIDDKVKRHAVHAPGIYSNFRNEPVPVQTAIRHNVKEKDGIAVVNPFTVKLDNHHGINSIVNGKGPATEVHGTPMRLSSEMRAE